jgi:hypothetical protein
MISSEFGVKNHRNGQAGQASEVESKKAKAG